MGGIPISVEKDVIRELIKANIKKWPFKENEDIKKDVLNTFKNNHYIFWSDYIKYLKQDTLCDISHRTNIVLIKISFPLALAKEKYYKENLKESYIDLLKEESNENMDKKFNLLYIKDLILTKYLNKIKFDIIMDINRIENGILYINNNVNISSFIMDILQSRVLLKRPNWDEYFMSVAISTAKRTNCIKRGVGAVVVKNNRIIGCGYNGTPFNVPNCYEGSCQRCFNQNISAGQNLHNCICLHAEVNALAVISGGRNQAMGSNLYVTLHPCLDCAKLICQYGIASVYYNEIYSYDHTNIVKDLFTKAGVKLYYMEQQIINCSPDFYHTH